MSARRVFNLASPDDLRRHRRPLTMTFLLLAGGLCFVAALFLPAYRSTGFFSFSGPGWKIAIISVVLIGAGAKVLREEGAGKALLCGLPGAVNIGAAILLVLGLCGTRGPAVQALGAGVLLGWSVLIVALLLRCRSDLRIGTTFWSAACVLLPLHALLT